MSTTARPGRPSTRAGSATRPSSRPSTRGGAPSSRQSGTKVITPSRVGVREVKKKERRAKAPAQFLLAMFFIVVASALAFGLLHDPTASLENAPSVQGVKDGGATSTNTGILRGR